MPELPEVETTRRALAPHLLGRQVIGVVQRRPDLRWPIPSLFAQSWTGVRLAAVQRRAKYLLLDTDDGTSGSALVHLGMSGSMRVLPQGTPAGAHDHWDWLLDSGQLLRYTDPRRFGCLLHQPMGQVHPLLAALGPEPLDPVFDGAHLHRLSRGRSGPVKNFLMDQSIVVGVGNIYAAESLFEAGIDPRRPAGKVSLPRYEKLATAVKRILHYAITRGGTTLRDFLSPDGAPGYFELELKVYDREGQPCAQCGQTLKGMRLGQRQSVWCGNCQR